MDLTSSKGAQPVPKFASFKPKSAPPESRHEEERHRDASPRHRSRHRSHRHRSRSREKTSRHQSRRDRKPREDDQPKAHQPDSKPPAEEKSDLYVIDRKGDIYNLTYGTIHRYNIPPYRLIGNGRVLGLPSRFKIDRNYHDDGTVLIRANGWHDDGARHKTRSLLAKTDTRERRIFRMRQDIPSDADAGQDYVPLSSHGSRKRRRIMGEPSPTELSDDEADKYGYRSIQGKAKPEQDIPSDMEATSASDSDGEGHVFKWEREIRKQNSELLRKAEENPTSIEGWLEVIEYQHVLLSGADGRRQLTGAERRSLADIKLSLYDKALKKVGNREGKDRLLLGYLNEGANLWESKKLREQWNAILKHNPGYVGLWVRYLDFRQSEFLDFTYEHCKDIYLDCMKLNASSSDNEEKNTILAYLFLRMTFFMREAGFPEIAVGLWQAVLEFTLFRPAKYTGSLKSEVLSAFSSFWESEVTRIGEVGAKGWKSGKDADLEVAVAGPQAELEPNSLFSSWCDAEMRLNRNARLPARSVDEVENDDPYRVVLWSDIEQFLPFFVNWQDPNLLVENFLAFCYLPPLNSLEASKSSISDVFLRNEIMHFSDVSMIKALEFKREEPGKEGPENLFELPVLQNLIHNVDSLFASQHWFSSLTAWKTATENENSVLDAEWIRRALRLLVDASAQDDGLAELTLAVEYAINAKEAKKYAKSLLKKRSSSLRLYNAYAIMESRTGNFSAATHVWATTFSMSANISETQKLEYGPLIHSWVWEYLISNKPTQALGLLMSVPNFSVDLKAQEASAQNLFTPTERLKAVRCFDEFSDHSLSVKNSRTFAAWSSLAVIFRYLADSSDLSSAIDLHTSACNRLSSSSQIPTTQKSLALEMLHQHRSRLLYHHITTQKAYKPAAIRELLLESLGLFPHNTAIVSLFTRNESRFRIDERIRDVLLTSPSGFPGMVSNTNTIPVTSSLLSIFTELSRPIYSGSTVHSARAAFEHALSCDTTNITKQSPDSFISPSLSLWKLYIYFELYRANNPAAAKRVYYRALRACPWSKDILMLAFNDGLWNGKGFDDWWELKRVYNVLVDKELRLHVEINDTLFDEAENIAVEREQKRIRDMGRSRERGKRNRGVIDLPDDRSSDGDVGMS
ncbi:E3 ubiquitin-protein ligase RNF213 [Talaromyces islandicus]|uniref:E3 ubiquitin-protein ligase RNF213 n=1 Tax=Talaromyces islandicus TaxID=28573 RepID=A0A0U1M5R0_TALIS|nr:E3 ubiquitin-protein ligase RNF213 [Talaromyces islandicus]